jgi:hypothetical protein
MSNWKSRFIYTPEHLEWLQENYRLMSAADLTLAFNERFNLERLVKSIRVCLRNHRVKSGRNGYFQKGNLRNQKPLWSERINKRGYVEISVPERDPKTGFKARYKYKHVWLWEQKNGPVPKGKVIIFKDSNKKNFKDNNLISVTKGALLSMNMHRYKEAPKEVKQSIIVLSELEAAGGFRTIGPRKKKLKKFKL